MDILDIDRLYGECVDAKGLIDWQIAGLPRQASSTKWMGIFWRTEN